MYWLLMSRTSRAVPARESTPQNENPSAPSSNNTAAGLRQTSLSIGMAIPSFRYILIRECGSAYREIRWAECFVFHLLRVLRIIERAEKCILLF
jgi:hypothetical protein